MAGPASPELVNESRQLSREFYENPYSYGEFSYTRDHKSIIGCIEPRDPGHAVHGEYKTIKQTPGGDIGEGADEAMVTYLLEDEVISLPTAMERNRTQRPFNVFDVHDDCAFGFAKVAIAGEMANPSDFTRNSFIEWAAYFNEADHAEMTVGKVSVAAAIQAVAMLEQADLDLLEVANSLYPAHKNTYPCKEQPKLSRTYVIGLHPNLGKDRNMKPTDPGEAQKIQAYNDTLAANVSDLSKAYRMSKLQRGYRFTTLLLRSAASRTVITDEKFHEFAFLDVRPDESNTETGLTIVERKY